MSVLSQGSLDHDQLLSDKAALEAENARLRKALEFYADRKNWHTRDVGLSFSWHETGDGQMERLASQFGTLVHLANVVHPQIIPDCGDRARSALKGA